MTACSQKTGNRCPVVVVYPCNYHLTKAKTVQNSTEKNIAQEKNAENVSQKELLYSVNNNKNNSNKAPWHEPYLDIMVFPETSKLSTFKNITTRFPFILYLTCRVCALVFVSATLVLVWLSKELDNCTRISRAASTHATCRKCIVHLKNSAKSLEQISLPPCTWISYILLIWS